MEETPLMPPLLMFALNSCESLIANKDMKKFNTYISHFKNKSGDAFIKNIIIKSCESKIDQKYLTAGSKEIEAINNAKKSLLQHVMMYQLNANYSLER